MFDDLNDLYQQVILDHSKSPRNFHKMDGANRTAEGNNPLCGDQVTVYLKLEEDRIQDISFIGQGCAISKAAASMMTDFLKGKTVAEAQAVFDKFQQMVTTGRKDAEELGKLAVFANVHKFPLRVKCAVLAWHAMSASLAGKAEPVSTENDA
jgi:nitrogen fixation protein NifU and related proteins